MHCFLNTKDDSIRKLVFGGDYQLMWKDRDWVDDAIVFMTGTSELSSHFDHVRTCEKEPSVKSRHRVYLHLRKPTSSWNVFPPSLSTCFCTFLFLPFFPSFFLFFDRQDLSLSPKFQGVWPMSLRITPIVAPFQTMAKITPHLDF